ncbi:MAG: TetR/AcrR family transcriptional regulator [Myxococcales bacterium]|nr:TetR/AcrR family transcriptional regulator [Myxococcales bacterium]
MKLNLCSTLVKTVLVPPRRPVQRRAARRRDSLLDAAARLLASEGYEAITTNAIAREAGAAVGTVYDYFPNKEAVLAALLERYRQRLEQLLLRTLADAGKADVDTLVDRGVRAFARFYREETGYAELWLGSQLTGPLREVGQAWGERFGELLGALVAERLGLPLARARVVALTFVHAVSAVVTLALGHPDEREALVDEAVALGQGYLRQASG